MNKWILTEVHTLPNEPGQTISNGEVETFDISSIDTAILIDSEKSENLFLITEYHPLNNIHHPTTLTGFAYLSVLEFPIWNPDWNGRASSPRIGRAFKGSIGLYQCRFESVPFIGSENWYRAVNRPFLFYIIEEGDCILDGSVSFMMAEPYTSRRFHGCKGIVVTYVFLTGLDVFLLFLMYDHISSIWTLSRCISRRK